jgi:hypothetical protein
MPKPLTWPEIKLQYPELAARLMAGDISARVEFARLAFGAEIVAEHHHAPAPSRGGSARAPQSSRPTARTQRPSSRPGAGDPVLDIIPAEQAPNPPF